jgi:singapore isolate B (sub-type 7) whole genome shotgun sequence assembly, scaffold_2
MDNTIDAPATNSGRMLKTSEGRERSLSEERVKFMEEECDVWDILLI